MNLKYYQNVIIFILIGIFCKQLTAQELKDSVHILTHKELSLKQFEISTPYIIELKNPNKQLVIIGSNHSNNPKDELFSIIDSLFHQTKPQFALNEGGEFEIFNTRDSTILNSWEPGFLMFLCQKDGVLRKSIEPPFNLECSNILKKHANEEVFLFYAYRNAIQLRGQKINLKTVDLHAELSVYLNSIGEYFFNNSDVELEYKQVFNSLYKKQFGIEFNFNDLRYNQISPLQNNSNLNQINRDIADFRDMHMIQEMQKYLIIYDRVFVVLGVSHVIRQEPVIRSYFEKKYG